MIKRILVVDDEEMIRSILSDFLASLDYEVIEASNGKEALDIFLKEPIDLVISDVRMPVMSGLDLLRLIKKHSQHTPVVMITGYKPTPSQHNAMTTKADGYLLKPFELHRLRSTLSQVIKNVEE